MKRCIAIITLCFILVLPNTACGAPADEESIEYCPTDYVFQKGDGIHREDDIFALTATDTGVVVRSKFCVNDVQITTDTTVYEQEYVIAGFAWELPCSIDDIEDITFSDSFICKPAEYKKVGQVSFELYEAGDYIFCSNTQVIERSYVKEPCIYRMRTDSGVTVIYEVENNE